MAIKKRKPTNPASRFQEYSGFEEIGGTTGLIEGLTELLRVDFEGFDSAGQGGNSLGRHQRYAFFVRVDADGGEV